MSKTHYTLPNDCRGDGYDIACAEHDPTPPTPPAGGVVTDVCANGYLCGYALTLPDAGNELRLCQHQGQFGPWYHISEYDGRGRFVANLGGHFNRRRAKSLGLPFGRPGAANR